MSSTLRLGASAIVLSAIIFMGVATLGQNVSADTNVQLPATGQVQNPGNTQKGGDSTRLENPLKVQSVEEFIIKIIDVLLVFALPIIILYIMYAGFLFVTAKGDSGQISTARSALLWAVVGGVIVLGAQIIISVIQGTITAF